MSAGAWVLLVALVVAGGFGLYRARTDGRFGRTPAAPGVPAATPDTPEAAPAPEPTTWDSVSAAAGVEPGERATLVQFSSAFCAPCRATRRVLSDVAGVVPGVVHVEIDAEQHLDLVRALDVVRTPTTIVLDATGAERTRAVGAPRKEQVLDALSA
ncbi:thioredoxin family protein [Nocardioides sp. AX2bis]|uniref:thioredoxin family protein n=1 Tax=Nocardioides sp. AX2bis TaxID=2653157 RepID=UPI0012F039F3|nr:thioredoxin family protein [Nocardioides sp. AX2bis]VXC49419.1 Thiol-disulfide isomerase/thioredoxin [Nocardioides sp. AX2bis]